MDEGELSDGQKKRSAPDGDDYEAKRKKRLELNRKVLSLLLTNELQCNSLISASVDAVCVCRRHRRVAEERKLASKSFRDRSSISPET